jgi:hypothetical protein
MTTLITSLPNNAATLSVITPTTTLDLAREKLYLEEINRLQKQISYFFEFVSHL